MHPEDQAAYPADLVTRAAVYAPCACAPVCGDSCTCSLMSISACSFECGPRCPCPASCPHRTVQRGVAIALEVYRTHTMGWGLRACSDLPAGTFVCSYIGEIIGKAEATRRYAEQALEKRPNYIYAVKEHTADGVLVTRIDPQYTGNVARFINHSCEPNLRPQLVRWCYVPAVAFFTLRPIPAREPLTFSYGDAPEQTGPGSLPCRCGAASCRGSLPFDP